MDKKIAVRYCSKTKSGNTARIASAIAKGAGVNAVSVTEESELSESVDVLFLGGAPYANIMAPELWKYANKLTPDKVKEVFLFTTSNWSRRTVFTLKQLFNVKGIKVHRKYFYAHVSKIDARMAAAEKFGRDALK